MMRRKLPRMPARSLRRYSFVTQIPLKRTTDQQQAEADLEDLKKSKDAVQSELDDLLIVFGDLEDQVAKQKVCTGL